MFNIDKFAEILEIDVTKDGKNTTSTFAGNICCPHCSDSSNHCGISMTGFYNCWKCGSTGSVTDIIEEIKDCSKKEAKAILWKCQDDKELDISTIGRKTKILKVDDQRSITLPKGSDYLKPIHLNYLNSRGFDPHYLAQKYHLKATTGTIKLPYRIIVPFYYNKQIVTYSSVDVTGTSKIKYIHQKEVDSVLPVKDTVYNIDNMKLNNNKMIICEGITDAWRVGDGAVSLCGKIATPGQIRMILKAKPKKILVLLDSDALRETKKLVAQLSAIHNKVSFIHLKKGDPGDLIQNEVNEIKSLI